ncbi:MULTISPECIES: DsbA family protein [Pantoea]|uniref:DsbA family protein n=1 Tax=Pantoea TaxID=53335 RepID=UPI001F4DC7D9|nr:MULTISPECIES: DsbA family protein [Pantoea]MCH9296354.1 DsbA family protein [Pantoea allii]
MMKLPDTMRWLAGIRSILILMCMFWVVPGQAREYVADKDYFELPDTVPGVPDVLSYFSFNCPHCYYFEMKSNIYHFIVDSLPYGTTFEHYHASRIGTLGRDLTRAWAVAIYLHKQVEMTPVLFRAMQQSHAVHSETDLQKLFTGQGVSAYKIKTLWNSPEITASVNRQDMLAAQLGLRFVPAFFVRGKYLVNNMALDTSTDASFEKDYAGVIRYLLNKKPSVTEKKLMSNK